MSDAITVITKLDPYTPADGRVIMLLERAPDSKRTFSAALPAKLEELLGPPAQTKIRAWELPQKLISGEPAIEGVFQLHVMEEIIIRALEDILNAIHHERRQQ